MLQAVNTASKSQLAKLLAAENITVQHNAAAQTASFDVKSRVLILPVWKEMSNDLYDMLVIHEVGHALDTPSEGWLNAIKDIAKRLNGSETRGAMNIKGFLNVVEDARIDKRQKRRFPGSRRNYVIGYKDLFDRDFFGLKGRDVNSLSFIDRMNIYFKGGFAMGIKFSPEERAFIKRAEDAETWAEVLKLTEEIYAYAKDKAEDDMQQSKLTSDMFAESDDEDGEGFGYGDDEDDEDENETSGRGSKSADDGDEEDDADDADGDGGDGDDDGDEVESDKDSDKTGAGNDGELDHDLPESETDKAFEDRKRELVASNAAQIVYVKVPKPVVEKIVDDYKVVIASWRKIMTSGYDPDANSVMMENFNRWKAEENAGISFMVKEFESKKAADIYSRVSIAKTGVVDTNKLHTFKYNDDIFRRLSVIPQGKNHGFVMFLDWSGSMDSYLKETLKQLYSMVLFCKRVQIPFEVYAFRSQDHGDENVTQFEDMAIPNTAQFSKFKLRNILSSRMNGADLNFAMAFMLMTRGRIPGDYLQSTPLNQAIVAAEYVVNMFRQRNKVQITNTIFLTDGDSDPIHFNDIGSGKSRYVLQDEVTRKEYDLGDVRWSYDGRNITRALLKRFKDRTGANLVGFFLTNGSFNRIADANVTNVTYEYREKMAKFFKDNNFVPVTSAGYDKYFVVNATKMRIVPGNLEVNGDMSRAKIASAFMKFSEKKTVNRVLLRQFIDLVCA